MKNDVFIETAAYIMNERCDIDKRSGFGLAFISVWNLLSSMKHKMSIGSVENCDIIIDTPDVYTAHAHPNEPLKPSAEDLHISAKTKKPDRPSFHFITDKFLCRRY